MRKLHRVFFIASFLVIVSLVSPFFPHFSAWANPGLRVVGAKLAANVAPGEVLIHKMVVSIGPQDSAMDVLVDVKGFGQNLEGSYICLEASEDTSSYSARTFITLDKTSFHLEPGNSQEVTATIVIPNDVGAGGRYALIYIHSQPIGQGQVGIVSAVAIPIMLTISDTKLVKTGNITDLSIGDVITGQPIVISTTLKNTGNHHYYKAQNEVLITDEKGNKVATISTPPSDYAIIPTYSVQFNITFEQKLSVGTYYVNSKVTLEDGTLLDERSTSFEVKKPYVPPPSVFCITLTPRSPALLQTPDGRFSISFPQGAVVSEVEVCLKPYPRAQLPSPPPNFKLGATCFRIDGIPGLLAKEATIKVKYSADDLAVAEGDASRLRLAYWDETQNKWVILPTQINEAEKTLTVTTNHLSIWAVLVAPAPTPINWLLVGGTIAAVVGVGLFVFFLLRKKATT